MDLPAVLLTAGLPAAACRILNISMTGAMIETQTPLELANQFMLTYADRSRWVQIVWSRASLVGVRFV